jgi:hypothetical protein
MGEWVCMRMCARARCVRVCACVFMCVRVCWCVYECVYVMCM